MIGDLLVPYTFWHLYAKTSHVHGIPLTNISAVMGLITEVSPQSYSRLITLSAASQYAHSDAKFE